MMRRHESYGGAEGGFSLLEVLVAMAVMSLVLAGTMSMMSTAMNAERAAEDVLDMNAQMRAAMDLIQRDLLQAGQGLPVGHRIGIPNGEGASPIWRPGPRLVDDTTCPGVDTFPLIASLPAVNVGPGLGPQISAGLGEAADRPCTDVITILAADSMFEEMPVVAIAEDGSTITFRNTIDIADSPDEDGDNLRVGDLLMLKKNSDSLLMYVTEVPDEDDDSNTVTFGVGDPMGLNQFLEVEEDPEEFAQSPYSMTKFRLLPPVDNTAPADGDDDDELDDAVTTVTRIRMITYYVDVSTDPMAARLVRAIGGGEANAVGLGLLGFRLTYDIAGQIASTTNVRMNDDDLSEEGACAPIACSENQIRKVTVILSMRAYDPQGPTTRFHGNHTQNTLMTQVSLRSLAFVDEYQ